MKLKKNRIIPDSKYRINIFGYNIIVNFLYFDLIIVDFKYSGEIENLKMKLGESLFKYFPVLSILGYKIEEKDNNES